MHAIDKVWPEANNSLEEAAFRAEPLLRLRVYSGSLTFAFSRWTLNERSGLQDPFCHQLELKLGKNPEYLNEPIWVDFLLVKIQPIKPGSPWKSSWPRRRSLTKWLTDERLQKLCVPPPAAARATSAQQAQGAPSWWWFFVNLNAKLNELNRMKSRSRDWTWVI